MRGCEGSLRQREMLARPTHRTCSSPCVPLTSSICRSGVQQTAWLFDVQSSRPKRPYLLCTSTPNCNSQLAQFEFHRGHSTPSGL